MHRGHDAKAELDTNIKQPVILAVDDELPLLALTLVKEFSVDFNTLTPDGWKHVHGVTKHSDWPASLLGRVPHKVKILTQ